MIDKLNQTIVSLAVENCELRQALKDAESAKNFWHKQWEKERNENMAEAVEKEG